jgi:hypothetical protein
MLIDTIKSDLLLARKMGISTEKNLLTTLVGDAERIGKDKGNRLPTDDEVLAVVKKFLKGIEENIKLKDLPIFHEEAAILKRYMPKMLSDESLKQIILDFSKVEPNKGKIMGLLAKSYKNMYDGKKAAEYIDTILKD